MYVFNFSSSFSSFSCVDYALCLLFLISIILIIYIYN